MQDSIFRRGGSALLHIRSEDSPSNIVTNLEERIPIYKEYAHTLHGYMKTKNSKNVTLEAQFYDARTGASFNTTSIEDSIQGTSNWQRYWEEIIIPDDATFVNIRTNSDIPDSGFSYTFYDDVGLIQWDSLKTINEYPVSFLHPNDFNYIQLFFNQPENNSFNMEMRNTILGDLDPLISYPKVMRSIIVTPGYFYFYDDSQGPVGNLEWSINNEETSFEQTPSWYCEYPGIYEVSLTVYGPNNEQNTATINVVGIEENSEDYILGDINNDGVITIGDVLLLSNFLMGLIDFQPLEFLSSDIDGNSLLNIYDILLISDLSI